MFLLRVPDLVTMVKTTSKVSIRYRDDTIASYLVGLSRSPGSTDKG